MRLCENCEKYETCKELCEEAEAYVSQDNRSQTYTEDALPDFNEIVIGDTIILEYKE